jgi:hypothetical protein
VGGTGPTPWQEVVAALDSLQQAPDRREPRRARRPLPSAVGGPVDTTAYLTASLGMPRWLERLQELEGLVRETEGRLRMRRRELAAELAGQPERFAERWRQIVARWDFGAVNELVDQHNRYYPVERKLPFDIRRRDYVDMWGIGWRRRPLDADWALAAFPPDLDAAAP